MTTDSFFEQLDARIAKYDLLCHPFYQAWSAGALTRDDLREYAQDYYHHVEAFPAYLAELGIRLNDGELRRAILANMCDEKGLEDGTSARARGRTPICGWISRKALGASREMWGHEPVAEVTDLIRFFHNVASDGTPEEALAAFYAYESQVPRVARGEGARVARALRRR